MSDSDSDNTEEGLCDFITDLSYDPSRTLVPLTRASAVGDKVGEGTYSNVYRLENQEFVVKVPKGEEGRSSRADFYREIAVLVRCNHPAILPIIDIIHLSKKNKIGTLLPYAPHTLRQLIRGKSVEQSEYYKSLIYQLLCGLAYLQSINVIHRDIKPENILLFDDGRLVIADFGFAIDYNCSPDVTKKEIVTISYRAPELILSTTRKYDFGIDTWAAGLTIYELLTKQYPFDYEDELALLMSMFSKLGTPSKESWPELKDMDLWIDKYPEFDQNTAFWQPIPRPELRRLISAMLTYRPDDRITALVALTDPYFDSIRNEKYEKDLNIDCLGALIRRMRYPKNQRNKRLVDFRTVALTKILEIAKDENLISKTFLLAVQYYDELSCKTIELTSPIGTPGRAESVAIACLTIAANLTERAGNAYEFFDYLPINIDMIKLRAEILSELGGDLLVTTPYDFHILLPEEVSEEQVLQITRLLAEIALTDIPFHYLADEIFSAAANVVSGTYNRYLPAPDDELRRRIIIISKNY